MWYVMGVINRNQRCACSLSIALRGADSAKRRDTPAPHETTSGSPVSGQRESALVPSLCAILTLTGMHFEANTRWKLFGGPVKQGKRGIFKIRRALRHRCASTCPAAHLHASWGAYATDLGRMVGAKSVLSLYPRNEDAPRIMRVPRLRPGIHLENTPHQWDASVPSCHEPGCIVGESVFVALRVGSTYDQREEGLFFSPEEIPICRYETPI